MYGSVDPASAEQITVRETVRKARKALALALLTCAVMLWGRYPASFIVVALKDPVLSFAAAVSSGEQAAQELAYQIILTLYYVMYITVPFVAAHFAYKALFGKSEDPSGVPHTAPRKPFLYLFGSIGAGYFFNFVSNLLLGEVFKYFTPEDEAPPTASVAAIILYFISMALLPAILEEWAFRGIILRRLLPYGRTGAIIVSAMLFGMVHSSPQQMLFAAFFGLLLGICYDYTRSIKFTALIHFTNNLLASLIEYAPESGAAAVFVNLFFYAFMALGIGAAIYYILSGVAKKKISFVKPAHIGYRLPASGYLANAYLNLGTPAFLITFFAIFYLNYFAS